MTRTPTLHVLTFRSGRRLHTFDVFAADHAAAIAYFDRRIAPDRWIGTGKVATFVSVVA